MSKAVIIGGGIVGLCSAYYLRRRGWEVALVDKGAMLDGCSYGNAGMIVPSHFVPLATPEVIWQGMRWLLNPKGPLRIRPAVRADWLRWGVRFVRSANHGHVARSAVPLRDISMFSRSLYQSLDKEMDIGLQQKGIMMLAATQQAYSQEIKLAKKAIDLGLDAVCLSKEEVIYLQGGIPMDVAGGVHYRCDAHLHPSFLMHKLIDYLSSDGVRIIRNSKVDNIHQVRDRITRITLSTKEELTADAYVLAAGAWSGDLAKLLNFRVPLMPGRGYSFMATVPNVKLQVPVLLCEARVAITPMSESIRFGGTMELGRMGASVNMKSVRGIVEASNRYFPELELPMPDPSSVWQGYRPCSPDGLPYIGFTKKVANLVVATGHAMMGVSLGPATGALVSELLSDDRLSVDLTPFSPDRFA